MNGEKCFRFVTPLGCRGGGVERESREFELAFKYTDTRRTIPWSDLAQPALVQCASLLLQLCSQKRVQERH
jgi:hypothetical protein